MKRFLIAFSNIEFAVNGRYTLSASPLMVRLPFQVISTGPTGESPTA
jgi:hypothetical protein